MQIYAQILVILACTALAQLPPSFHAFTTTIIAALHFLSGGGGFLFAANPPRGMRTRERRAKGYKAGFEGSVFLRLRRRGFVEVKKVANLSPQREGSSRVEFVFFLFFCCFEGEGSFIFVGRGCLFFFCETFWHDFGMDGLECLILINAVRLFNEKKEMELVIIPSFYVYLCVSCSSRVSLIFF